MGFPSPAGDHIERRLNIYDFIAINPATMMILDVGDRLFIVDRSISAKSGNRILFEVFGESQVGKLMGNSIITQEGEAYEGGVLEEVELLGVVTSEILRVHEAERPTI